jgi:hypothetical protein
VVGVTAIRALFEIEATTWALVVTSALIVYIVWMLRKTDRLEPIWRGQARIHQELWIVVPIGALSSALHHWHSHTPWMIIFDALTLYNWWNLRNWPEENRWKKRGKKAKEAIAVRAGRLVVVPVGAS